LEASSVKIILTQDVPNLGQAGDVKDVAGGYARNYLLPQGMAVKASPGAQKEYERRRAADARRTNKLLAEAEVLAQRLAGVTLTMEAKAGETGRLYGSITPSDLADALGREVGEAFDRRKHILSDPIREVGEHTVAVRLAPEVTAEVKVIVTPEGGELPVAQVEETSEAAEAGVEPASEDVEEQDSEA
jgi:large subunit ribosomal protein L9